MKIPDAWEFEKKRGKEKMEETRVFDRENTVPADMLMKLGEYLSFHVEADSGVIIEFYSIRYKRKIDTFVLGYYPPQNIWSLQEPIKSFLLEWDGSKFVNTSEEEKKIFSEENSYNNWSWFCFD